MNNFEGASEEMITTKSELKEWLDAEKYIRGGVRDKILYLLQGSERAVLQKHQRTLRKLEYHLNAGHKIRELIYRLKLNRLQNRYALHIPPNTCGKGLRLLHVGSVLINDKARLGNNCALHINTAIVAGNSTNGVPEIGNHVLICTGATLVGGIRIADDIVIGANALVNKSFTDENITVAGVPAKKIKEIGRRE